MLSFTFELFNEISFRYYTLLQTLVTVLNFKPIFQAIDDNEVMVPLILGVFL
jgi:hypothetical protein